VEAFVSADLTPSAQAIGASIKSAAAVSGTIRAVDVQILAAAMAKPEGAPVTSGLEALLDAEELASPLSPELRHLYEVARKIVVGEVTPPPPPAGVTRESVVSAHGIDRAAALVRLDELRTKLAAQQYEDDQFDIEVTAISSDEAK
jgi:hypothetical protein